MIWTLKTICSAKKGDILYVPTGEEEDDISSYLNLDGEKMKGAVSKMMPNKRR